VTVVKRRQRQHHDEDQEPRSRIVHTNLKTASEFGVGFVRT
jgi:hypothetical protein